MNTSLKLLLLIACLCGLNFTSAQQTRNVIWITYDGLRWQEVFQGIDSSLMVNETYTNQTSKLRNKFWDPDPGKRRQKLLPFFWEVIAGEGQLYGNRMHGNLVNVTNDQWFSYPGYNEILTGRADSSIQSNAKVWNKNTTLLEFANGQKGFRGKVAAFGSWDVFPYIINEARSGLPVNAGFEEAFWPRLSKRARFLNELQRQTPSPWTSVRLDVFTHHYAKEYLRRHRPRLLYIAYGETDDFAHDGDYDAYIEAAHRTDAFIRDLWNFVQSHPAYRNKTSLVISTDHGRGTLPVDHWRSHGTKIKGSDEIWIAILGPDSPALGELTSPGQLYQNQLAQTVARLLGLPYTVGGKWIETAFK